jgi:hypothetical protein
MQIRNLGNPSNVQRADDRSQRSTEKAVVLVPQAPVDSATISNASRSTAAAVENLAERARNAGGDRSEVVAAAKAKLASGALSSGATLQATAQKLLDARFLTA